MGDERGFAGDSVDLIALMEYGEALDDVRDRTRWGRSSEGKGS